MCPQTLPHPIDLKLLMSDTRYEANFMGITGHKINTKIHDTLGFYHNTIQ